MNEQIALLRGGGIGDAIVALPALRALRRRRPDAHLAWVGHTLHRDVFHSRALGIEEVITLPSNWEQRSLLTEEFVASMRERHWDLAIQLHGGGRFSNPFIHQWGAKATIGMATTDAFPLERQTRYQPWQPEVLRFLDVIRLLDDAATPRAESVHPDLPLTEQEQAGDALDLLVIHPGARDPRRRWPADRFVETINALDLPSVVIGSSSEAAICADIANRTAALDLCGALDLTGMIRLIAHARVVLANDSGPRHLAEAVGTRSVAIYWIGNLINAGPMARDLHHVEVSWTMACPRCQAPAITADGTGMARCGHSDSWVADTEVEAIVAAVQGAWSDYLPRKISSIAGRTSSR